MVETRRRGEDRLIGQRFRAPQLIYSSGVLVYTQNERTNGPESHVSHHLCVKFLV